ncbi:DUF6884 domain-containing protein [Sinorhizobium sp. BJ1]|uniref:DUF6884 domain-containing protein n=1 Tax=Sinorhizobium sp. BJ1 TaxID=2035455 RepID=UPI000BE96F9D
MTQNCSLQFGAATHIGTMMHLILTTCTNRKRYDHSPALSARALPCGSLQDVSEEWKARVLAAPQVASAGDLYCGRSFSETTAAAGEIGAQLFIASAGLGFLTPQQPVPSYNLTVSRGTQDCILDRITPSASEAEWWGTLVDQNVIRRTLRSADGLILIAVGKAYLKMLVPILSDLPQETIDRLRIFVGPDVSMLPARLMAQTLPYDDRLDGPDSPIRGTRIDFVSRALHHFTKTVMDQHPTAPVAKQAKHVEELSRHWGRPNVRPGARRSDAEIKALLRQHWEHTGGLSTKLLRVLRDELAVACEQKRFSRLASEVRNEEMST